MLLLTGCHKDEASCFLITWTPSIHFLFPLQEEAAKTPWVKLNPASTAEILGYFVTYLLNKPNFNSVIKLQYLISHFQSNSWPYCTLWGGSSWVLRRWKIVREWEVPDTPPFLWEAHRNAGDWVTGISPFMWWREKSKEIAVSRKQDSGVSLYHTLCKEERDNKEVEKENRNQRKKEERKEKFSF